MNIGLTGGIGCGKSTALEFFREAGAVTLDADAVVHQLMASDEELIGDIADAFGKEVLDGEGKIDRKTLGGRVFGNSEALALLESLVHPRVRNVWMCALGENHPVLVVEIPLLFEKDLQDNFSLTICLSSDPAVQLQRLKARGMSDSQINQRNLQQLPLEDKMRRADIILHNNGSRDHLKEQVERVMAQVDFSQTT